MLTKELSELVVFRQRVGSAKRHPEPGFRQGARSAERHSEARSRHESKSDSDEEPTKRMMQSRLMRTNVGDNP